MRAENPSLREDAESNTDIDIAYQFPDYGQHLLPANNGTVEGMVATFIYSLWDDIGTRTTATINPYTGAPTPYRGDNEDLGDPLGYEGSWLLDATEEAVQMAEGSDGKQYRVIPYLKAYMNAFLKRVNTRYPQRMTYHLRSITDMYEALRSANGDIQNSATPTTATVAYINQFFAQSWRQLHWNDNTEPSVISYSPVTTGQSLIDLLEENETAFWVYRKYLGTFIPRHMFGSPFYQGPEDVRTDPAFQLIAQTGSNVTMYTDKDVLRKGYYVYVIVAVHWNGFVGTDYRSIPKAWVIAEVDDPIINDRFDDDKLPPDLFCISKEIIPPGSTVRYKGWRDSLVNPAFQWIAVNKPPFLQLQGITSSTLTVTNSYTTGVSGPWHGPMSLRCVITDQGVSDTGSPIYVAYTPLDSTMSFVWTGTSGGYQPEYQSRHSLDFITRAGETVISVRKLNHVPQPTSGASPLYNIRLSGIPAGTTTFNHVRLLRMRHPHNTIIGGAGDCGFRIFQTVNGQLVEDVSRSYALEEIPLATAQHSTLGVVTNQMAALDSMIVPVSTQDHVWLSFSEADLGTDTIWVPDSLVYVDSSQLDWITDYVLEIGGTYHMTGSAPFQLSDVPSTGSASTGSGKIGMGLDQNSPNPVSGKTTITFSVGAAGHTLLELFDVNGARVRTLVNDVRDAGMYAITTNVSDLPPGVYYYRLTAGGESQTRSMTVIR